MLEKSDNLLEETDAPKISEAGQMNESKATIEEERILAKEQKLRKEHTSQINSLSTTITNSITSIDSEIKNLPDGEVGLTTVQSFKANINAVDDKIDSKFNNLFSEYICLLDDDKAEAERKERNTIVSNLKAKINASLSLLNKKIKEHVPVNSVTSSGGSRDRKDTYLKRIDPPTFKGDIVEYPDFVRKWKALVGEAGLNVESELDRLRDHIPPQAAKALYGASSMLEVLEGFE